MGFAEPKEARPQTAVLARQGRVMDTPNTIREYYRELKGSHSIPIPKDVEVRVNSKCIIPCIARSIGLVTFLRKALFIGLLHEKRKHILARIKDLKTSCNAT